uniref:Uncharacterized protein n=1 Tax=Rhizophora mucronata TaxID=61149 RepID=A0A2P2P9X8_RHIMU
MGEILQVHVFTLVWKSTVQCKMSSFLNTFLLFLFAFFLHANCN